MFNFFKQMLSRAIKYIKKVFSTPTITLEYIGSILLTLVASSLFLKVTHEILERETLQLDSTISHFVYSFRTPELTTFMLFITNFGEQYVWYIVAIIATLLFFTKHVETAIIFILSIIGEVTTNIILKSLVARPRPTINPLITENFYSFPSGHSMTAFVLYGFCMYLVVRFIKNWAFRIVLCVVLISLIFLIGLSRVYLGVHYPSDVIGSYLVGLILLLGEYIIYQSYVMRKNRIHL